MHGQEGEQLPWLEVQVSLPTISTGNGIWRMKMNTEHMGTLCTCTLFRLQTPKGTQRESTNKLNIVTEKIVLYPTRLKLDVDKNVLGGGVQESSPKAFGHGLQLQGKVVLHPSCPAELLPLCCSLLTELAHFGAEIIHLWILHGIKLMQTYVQRKRER